MKFYKALKSRRILGLEKKDESSYVQYTVHLWWFTWHVYSKSKEDI